MDNINFSICGADALSIPNTAIDKLLAEGDGALCLIYLYICRRGGEFSPDAAARALNLTEREAERAVTRLTALGIVRPMTPARLRPSDEIPEYTSSDVSERGGADLGFRIVLSETQRVFGRMLSSQELKQLFGIYDHLRLPPEVMLLLVNYCVERCHEKFGAGKLPSMRTIEKEGFVWADAELLTIDSAEEYIKRRRETADNISRLKRALGITSRDFSASERKYAESWLDMGFPVESIEIAYDRTLLKTGALKWGYMNSIVKNWHEKNLHTPTEIQTGDTRPQQSLKSPPPAAPPPDSDGHDAELERMKKILDVIVG